MDNAFPPIRLVALAGNSVTFKIINNTTEGVVNFFSQKKETRCWGRGKSGRQTKRLHWLN